MRRFVSVPKNLFSAFLMGWSLVLTGWKAERDGDHQIILTKPE